MYNITHLSQQDILVNSDFGDILKKVREQLPALKVRTGGDGVPLRPKAKLHPMTKLTNYIEKNNLRLVDFFRTLDKDGSMGVTREEFSQGLAVGLPVHLYDVRTLAALYTNPR